MNDFERALAIVFELEGGYVDNPNDRGGATKYGITQATLDVWRGSRRKPKGPVGEITRAEASDIYRAFFWDKARCPDLPWPLSAAHFDAAVNHGPPRAAKLLQEALGTIPDGIIGPKTLSAVRDAFALELLEEWYWIRVDFFVELAKKPSQLGFLRGWINRVQKLRRALA